MPNSGFREAVSRTSALPHFLRELKSKSLHFSQPCMKEPDGPRHPFCSHKLGSRLPFSGKNIRGRREKRKRQGRKKREGKKLIYLQTHRRFSSLKSSTLVLDARNPSQSVLLSHWSMSLPLLSGPSPPGE